MYTAKHFETKAIRLNAVIVELLQPLNGATIYSVTCWDLGVQRRINKEMC